MIREEATIFYTSLVDRLYKTLISKGHDYATEDVLSNFKRLSLLATILGITLETPLGYALFMVLMKLDRVCNLYFNKKRPNNESLEDSFLDLLGYTMLSAALNEESSNNSGD